MGTSTVRRWEKQAMRDVAWLEACGLPKPPYKVGKQFPYENDRRAGKTHPGRLEIRHDSGLVEVLKEG